MEKSKDKKEKKPKEKKEKEKKPKNEKKSKDKQELKQYFPLTLPYATFSSATDWALDVQTARILSVLKSTVVPKILIGKVDKAEDWLAMVESMSHNKSITSVIVSDVNFEGSAITPAHLIRRGPPSLKEFVWHQYDEKLKISIGNFIDLCSAIRESKTLEKIGFELAGRHFTALPDLVSRFIANANNIKAYSLNQYCYEPYALEALKSATNVTELSFHSIHFEEGDKKYLKEIMKRLKKLELNECNFREVSGFGDLFDEAKNLTSLTLVGNIFNPYDEIAKSVVGLKNQLEELSIGNKQIPELTEEIVDLLLDNNTLKKLVLTNNSIDESGCKVLMDALSDNTNLTHLSFINEQIGSHAIGQFLQTNRSLKTLELKQCNRIANLHEVSEALKVNTSLTELHIQRYINEYTEERIYNDVMLMPFNVNQESHIKFAEALRVNKTLRKLSFDFEGSANVCQQILASLHYNPNLRHVCICPHVPEVENMWMTFTQSTFSEDIEKCIIDLLKANIGLRYVKYYTRYQDHTDWPRVLEQMNKNHEARQARINQAVSAMKMAVLRPNFVGTHLPLEVWRIIFSFFAMPELDINFVELFSKVVDQYNIN